MPLPLTDADHKRQDKLSCSVNERHTAWVNNEFPP